MSDVAPPTTLISASGMAAQYPPVGTAPSPVAATIAAEINRLRILIAPVACWRVDDLCFDFDSSFPGVAIVPGLQQLSALLSVHLPPSAAARAGQIGGGCPLSIFAHADPVGDDEYNKELSGRRATSIYALLVHDVELWDRLYTRQLGNDHWSEKTVQAMLDATSAGQSGVSSGSEAARIAGNTTQRKALYGKYMDALWPAAQCLEKGDFLGGGKDAGGKADYQGCSEFNPLLLPSQQDQDAFNATQDKSARNRANVPNRRVMALIFRRGSAVDPSLWPCPRVHEDTAACRKRFWSDGEKRRSALQPDAAREYSQGKNTFACRFYDRLVSASPCEQILQERRVRLYDQQCKAIAGACFQLTMEGDSLPSTTGVADAQGTIVLRDVKVPSTCLIRWGPAPTAGTAPEYIYGLNMYLTIVDVEVEQEARMKLNNLGYGQQHFADNVSSFQGDYATLASPPLDQSGKLDAATLRVLRDVYAQCANDLKQTQVR